MSVQQRYTPVPGMGRSGYSDSDMQQVGHAPASGYGNSNPFDTPNGAPANSPFYPASQPPRSYSQLPNPPPPMDTSYAHQSIPSEAYWPENNGAHATGYATQATKAKRNKWIKIGAIVFGVLAIIAVVVGVVVSQVDKKHSTSSGSSSSSDSSGTQSNPNDPSDFSKDSRLHQSFYGFAYTPQDAQPPWCGTSLANVTRDIQILSQLTTRIRLYGSDCNTTAFVLQAIQDTKVNMTVWPAIYVDSNETAYIEQLQAVKDALTTYGTNNIAGITVGNEYILDTAGSASNTSSAYIEAVDSLLEKVNEVRANITGMNLPKTLPIGTSDAGADMSTTLGDGIDYFMANVHPWFGGVPINDAAAWTAEFFNNWDASVAAISINSPEAYIAETGWPTASLNASLANDGATGSQGDANVENLQTFLDTFVCQANSNGTKYFYFEAFDEPWKAEYGGVEPFWGLFDQNRNLKNVTIPTCS